MQNLGKGSPEARGATIWTIVGVPASRCKPKEINMLRRWLLLFTLAAAAPAAAAGQLLEDQVFDRYSPLAAADEFSRRVFSPTTFDRLRRFQRHIGRKPIEQTVNLADERYDMFVPDTRPEVGYGLLVFVSPVPRWELTRDWKRELDRAGIIYVSARRSGNAENVHERRIPLALHAVENIAARYPVNLERVYVSGFSGGSRTAIRIAAAYADVFHGAVLVGGAKVIGEEDFAPPPIELMTLLQRRMRLVYSTGGNDTPNRVLDARGRREMEKRCVAGVFDVSQRRLDHWVPGARTFRMAIERLDTPLSAAELAAQDACMPKLMAQVDADLSAAEQAFADGDRARAGELLGAADIAWGGLATGRLVKLARLLAP
jgi:pimeloyl-ACP methyl ester carboxylesterase